MKKKGYRRNNKARGEQVPYVKAVLVNMIKDTITRKQAAVRETARHRKLHADRKIIPFPGVSLSDHFQNEIDNFLKVMGYMGYIE